MRLIKQFYLMVLLRFLEISKAMQGLFGILQIALVALIIKIIVFNERTITLSLTIGMTYLGPLNRDILEAFYAVIKDNDPYL